MKRVNRLLVVSHVTHYRDGGKLYGYGPYSREIDIWADLFAEVVIAAPCRDAAPPSDWLPFSRPNISVVDQAETGGETATAKLKQAVLVPLLVRGLVRAMKDADAIHVRCPGNLGLLGAILAPMFSKYLVAKYAGQWNGYRGEPWTVRLQRRLLASRWWSGPVTVYGNWPDQPAHIVPFFTSMMTNEQIRHAQRVAASKQITSPLRVLFSGTLTARKRVGALLSAAQLATQAGVPLEVVILGDGPDRDDLERQAHALGIRDRVRFIGALPFDRAMAWYEWAHCLVLPSQHSEGWPKVVAEGMAHGLICIGVRHGQVPVMLEGRGILTETGAPEEIADALAAIAAHPDAYTVMSRDASAWAHQFSLETLRDALRDLLAEQWDVLLRRARLTHGPSTV
jgi:glycosyltransferase involved in cell wall biosynthesis